MTMGLEKGRDGLFLAGNKGREVSIDCPMLRETLI